eukprot:m.31392 g.31392  ORF g.31392 m.31392 type:complete len:138 (-) comp4877_c1_seq1:519-932(-)
MLPPAAAAWARRTWRLIKDVAAILPLYVIVAIAIVCPPFRRRMKKNMESERDQYTPAMMEMLDKTVSLDEFYEVFFSNFRGVNQILHSRFVQNSCLVSQGSKMADVSLIERSSGRVVALRSLQRPGRPLVLNFGSCT